MEHLLFAAAERAELDAARSALSSLPDSLSDRWKVDFLCTGIGAAAMACRLTAAIYEARAAGVPYTLVVNIGVAGSYDLQRFPVGSAVSVSAEYFGDLGFDTPSGFKTLFQYQAMAPDDFPFVEGGLPRPSLPYPALETLLKEYASGPGITVQTVTADPVRIAARKKDFQAAVETMEGAAFHYVARMEKISFFQIRTISNAVGESDSRKWDNEGALETLSACCLRLLKCLCVQQ